METLTEKYYVNKMGLAQHNRGRVWRQIEAATWPPYKCDGCGGDVLGDTDGGNREVHICEGCTMLTIGVWVDDPNDEFLNSRLDQEASVSATIFERKEQC